MGEAVRPYATVSDKIRALGRAGYKRTEIAQFLGKTYQHVRNVLVQGPPSRASRTSSLHPLGVGEDTAQPFTFDASTAIFRLPINPDGSVRLPPAVLEALDVKPGGVAIAELENDRLVLLSAGEAVRRAQAMVRALSPTGANVVDDFIAERRREAQREERGG